MLGGARGVGAVVSQAKSDWFATGHLKPDLARRAIRGGSVTALAQVFQFALQAASTMILARLLTPADFGLVGMAMVTIGVIGLFRDLGLSTATVQRAEINQAQVSTLFWANVALSVVLLMLATAAAPLIARFYGEPRLTAIAISIAAIYAFGGLAIQHTALLRRQMRFTAVALIQCGSLATGLVVGVACAVYGAGYWALVALMGGTSITNGLLTWAIAPWCPSKPSTGPDVREMLTFGGHLTGFNCIAYIMRNVDQVLIGAVWGASALGIYAKAYGLLLLPLQQISGPIAAVAIPLLSRLQDDPGRYRQCYSRIIQLIGYVTMPVGVLLAILSDEVVLMLLGSQWLEAGAIFRIFALLAIVYPISSTIGWVMVSLGKTQRMLKLAAGVGVCSVTAFCIGLPWGPKGVAIAATVCFVAALIPSMSYGFRGTPVSLEDIRGVIVRPLLLSMLLAFTGAAVVQLGGSLHVVVRVVVVVAAAIIATLATVALCRPVRRDVQEILASVLR